MTIEDIKMFKNSNNSDERFLYNLLYEFNSYKLLDDIKRIRIDRFPTYCLEVIEKYFGKDSKVYNYYNEYLFEYFVNIIGGVTHLEIVKRDLFNFIEKQLLVNNKINISIDEYVLKSIENKYSNILNREMDIVATYDKYYELITKMFTETIQFNSSFFNNIFYRGLLNEENSNTRKDKREISF